MNTKKLTAPAVIRVPTAPADLARINEFFNTVSPQLANLHDRWLDEREYEDFADYVAVAQKWVPAGFTFVRLTKRPFALEFKLDSNGFTYRVTATSRNVSWNRVVS